MERGDTFYLAFLHFLFGSRFPAISEEAGHWSNHSRYSDFVIVPEASSCFRVSHSFMRSLKWYIHPQYGCGCDWVAPCGAGVAAQFDCFTFYRRNRSIKRGFSQFERSSMFKIIPHNCPQNIRKKLVAHEKCFFFDIKTFAISFSRDGLGTRYPISYCAIRFAPPSPRLRRSPSCFCVRPLWSRTSLIFDLLP